MDGVETRGDKIAEELKAHGLGIHQFVPYNAKIADITHADTAKHTLTLGGVGGVLVDPITGQPETRKIVMVIVGSERMGGVSSIRWYPNEGIGIGAYQSSISTNGTLSLVIANATQRAQYALGVADDDFDVYCLGYVVEV